MKIKTTKKVTTVRKVLKTKNVIYVKVVGKIRPPFTAHRIPERTTSSECGIVKYSWQGNGGDSLKALKLLWSASRRTESHTATINQLSDMTAFEFGFLSLF